MMVYYTDVESVEELSDLIIDSQSNRQLELISSDLVGLKIRKVFSGSGIAWVDKDQNEIFFRSIGTCRERFVPTSGEYV